MPALSTCAKRHVPNTFGRIARRGAGGRIRFGYEPGAWPDRVLMMTDRGESGIIGQGGERTGRVRRGATAVSVTAALRALRAPQWPVPGRELS